MPLSLCRLLAADNRCASGIRAAFPEHVPLFTPRGSTAFEKALQQAQKAINALTQGAKSDALSE